MVKSRSVFCWAVVAANPLLGMLTIDRTKVETIDKEVNKLNFKLDSHMNFVNIFGLFRSSLDVSKRSPYAFTDRTIG